MQFSKCIPKTFCLILGLLGFSASLQSQLVAHWPLDEVSGTTAADVVGSNDGTLSGFPGDDSQWQTGMVGGALRFDGADDFVSHGFELPRPAGSLVFWAQPEAAAVGVAVYESDFPATAADYDGFSSGGPVLERHVLWGTDAFCAVYEDEDVENAGEVVACGGDEVTFFGDWNHVAMTWDTLGDLNLYVNCQQVEQEDLTAFTFAGRSSSERYFGRASEGARFFNGLLDDIRVYDNVLSQSEIIALAGDCPGFVPPTPVLEVPTLSFPGLLALLLLLATAAGSSRDDKARPAFLKFRYKDRS